jgi:hypothetical protein
LRTEILGTQHGPPRGTKAQQDGRLHLWQDRQQDHRLIELEPRRPHGAGIIQLNLRDVTDSVDDRGEQDDADRELLDTMDVIVELTGLGASRYGGNRSHYTERKAIELTAARRDLAVPEHRVAEIGKHNQAAVEQKSRKDRAVQKKRERGDLPRVHLDQLRDRSEKTTGEDARLAKRRRSQARDAAASARERIAVLQSLWSCFR